MLSMRYLFLILFFGFAQFVFAQEDINNIKDELKDIKELMFTLIQKLEHNKVS